MWQAIAYHIAEKNWWGIEFSSLVVCLHNCQIKIIQMASWDPAAKFNSCQYFRFCGMYVCTCMKSNFTVVGLAVCWLLISYCKLCCPKGSAMFSAWVEASIPVELSYWMVKLHS